MKMTILFIFMTGAETAPPAATALELALLFRLVGFIISRSDGLVMTNRHASGRASLVIDECMKEALLTIGYSGHDSKVELKTVVL